MDNSAFNSAFCKLQDIAIIDAGIKVNDEINKVLSHESFQNLIFFYLSDAEKNALNNNPDVDFPLVFSEVARQVFKTDEFIIDPLKSGKKVKFQDWMTCWLPFQFLNIEKIKDEKKKDYVSMLIGRGLAVASQQYSKDEMHSLIDRLWQYRWIYNAYECADWRIFVLGQSEKEVQEIIKNGKEAEKTFDELDARLNHIKDTVQNLDEWLEGLYLLTPLVKYALKLHVYMESADEAVKQRQRFIEEISADIYAIFFYHRLMDIPLVGKNTWSSTHLPKQKVNAENIRAVKRDMSYKYKARVFYPRFWFDEALRYLTNNEEFPSSILDKYNVQHLISMSISYDPDDAIRWFKGIGFSKDK